MNGWMDGWMNDKQNKINKTKNPTENKLFGECMINGEKIENWKNWKKLLN